MKNKDFYIQQGLVYHLSEFKKRYPNLDYFIIALQGSQNYGLDLFTKEYKSDIDTKILVLPSLEDIVLNKTPISTTLILENNEHIDVKDVRLYFEIFKKQNINFLEILFTNYYIVNEKYKDLWEVLISSREDIAHYNFNQALKCIAGMSKEKKKALCHPYPSIKDKIDKYGYDGKQLHHIIRMADFISAYTQNKTYKECLTFLPHKELMLKAKLNNFSLEDALKYADFFDNFTVTVKNNFLKEEKDNFINSNVDNILKKIQYELIKRKLKDELFKEV